MKAQKINLHPLGLNIKETHPVRLLKEKETQFSFFQNPKFTTDYKFSITDENFLG